MPVRTYMVVDARHDHSFRIPRPEDSVRFGTPNACNDCHKNQAAALLLQTVRDTSTPGIARATALGELANYLDADSLNAAEEALRSPDALVRLAAVQLVGAVDAATRWGVVAPLLNDPVRAVRTAAADALVDCVPSDATPDAWRAFNQALTEYLATQKLNADRPEAHLSLGNLYSRQGKTQDADTEYRQAIRLWPRFVPAYINLADLSRAQQRDDLAEQWLTQAADFAPGNAQVLMALGLLRVRQHRDADSLQLLRKAASIASDSAHYQFVYGVALYSNRQTAEGLKVLHAAYGRFPANRELLLGLASLTAHIGDVSTARLYAERFVEVAPADPRGRQMLNQLGAAQH
jgi:tetratricopeptide (TPR) repeat protein